jgi:outer membrane lipase/esterase
MPILRNDHFRSKLTGWIGCLLFLIAVSPVAAEILDAPFRDYVERACDAEVTVPLSQEFADLCSARTANSSGSNTPLFNLNIGTGGAQSRNALTGDNLNDVLDERLEERTREKPGKGKSKKKGKRKGAGAGASDDGGFGFMISAQSGEVQRKETDFGSAYESDLSAYILGIDYLFGQSFVLGVAGSSLEDEGNFTDGIGSFLTQTTSGLVYGSWAISESFGLGFYSGKADNEYLNSRAVVFGDIDGTVSGDFSGEQSLSGVSMNYDLLLGSWSVGAYYSMDQVKTDIEAYTETGFDPDTGTSTLLEFVYPDQRIKSKTGTMGLRTGYAFNMNWGAIVSGIEYAAVRENEDDKRFINVAFPYAPEYFFGIETDDPDRDYNYQTFNLLAAFNNGNQLFLNFEQRSGHEFLDDSFVTAGAIFGF